MLAAITPGAILFIFLSAVILLSAFCVVILRNLFRAALSLGVVLIGVAGLFLLLEAEFLAFAQILVYVGAVLTLVIFAIMLTQKSQGAPVTPPARKPWVAAAASVTLFVLLATTIQMVSLPGVASKEAVSLPRLGQELVTRLILPFEVISLVFVAAMVAAIAIAAPDKKSR